MRYRREPQATAPKPKPLHKVPVIDELGARTVRSVASAYGYVHGSEVHACFGDWLTCVRKEFEQLPITEEQRKKALTRLSEKIDEIIDLLAGRALIDELNAEQRRLAHADAIARIDALFAAAAIPRKHRTKDEDTEDEDEETAQRVTL